MTPALRLAALVAAPLLACSPDPEERIRTLGARIPALHEEHAANAAFLDAAARNAATTVAFSADDLARLADDALPLTLDAASFHGKLQGNFVIERLSEFRFAPGNRVDAVATLRGERLRYTGDVPAMFKAEVTRFIADVQAGVNVALRLRLALAGRNLEVHATAAGASFAANSGSNARLLVDEMNQRALRRPIPFDLGADPRLVPVGALVTAKHLVLQFDATRPAPAAPAPSAPAPAPTGGPTRPRRPGG